MNNVREFLQIANRIDVIVSDRQLTWADKYDLIFSNDISCRIFEIDPMREYFDPDTSYEEDVLAFAEAVRRRATELESCLN